MFLRFRLMWPLLFLVCLLVPVNALAQSGLSDEDITVLIPVDLSGTVNRYNMAVVDFQPIKEGGRTTENNAKLARRLSTNLDMTGYFNLIDPRASLEGNVRAGLSPAVPFEYSPWAQVGANFVIKGGIDVSGSSVTMELRLFDVSTGIERLAKRYNGPVKNARQMINRFTNEVLLSITGEAGVFGSKIIYVAGEKEQKSIMLTELGSDEAESLAGSKGGPSTMPTIGAGNKTAWIHRNAKKRWELLVGGKVIYTGEQIIAPAFRTDGTVVAGLSGPTSTNLAVFEGRTPRVISNGGGIDISPTFSPDGSRMAYVSNQAGGASIYVASSSGGAGSRLTPGGKSTDPAWSPKGDKIAFVSRERDVCVINPDGSGLVQLTGGQGRNMHPSFSPDGRMIVFSSDRGGRTQLYVMAANGDKQQPLIPEVSGTQTLPAWSPEMPE